MKPRAVARKAWRAIKRTLGFGRRRGKADRPRAGRAVGPGKRLAEAAPLAAPTLPPSPAPTLPPGPAPTSPPGLVRGAEMDVVFTGGTGRSGTTIMGELLGMQPGFVMIPIETRFISLGGGLCDLALERVTFDQFEKSFLGEWYTSVGRHRIDRDIDRSIVDPALARLRDRHRAQPWTSARVFAHAILDPFAERAGARGWVEMTPGNALRARPLQRMFPSMRLVHTYRDGRDVACSVVPLHWGPTDIDTGLDWWADRLERAFASVARVQDGRAMNLQWENLIARNREAEYRRLIDFLRFPDAPEMRAFFDDRMTEANAHIGRWRRDVPPGHLEEFEAHHHRLAAGLLEKGYPYMPLTPDEVLAPAM